MESIVFFIMSCNQFTRRLHFPAKHLPSAGSQTCRHVLIFSSFCVTDIITDSFLLHPPGMLNLFCHAWFSSMPPRESVPGAPVGTYPALLRQRAIALKPHRHSVFQFSEETFLQAAVRKDRSKGNDHLIFVSTHRALNRLASRKRRSLNGTVR